MEELSFRLEAILEIASENTAVACEDLVGSASRATMKRQRMGGSALLTNPRVKPFL